MVDLVIPMTPRESSGCMLFEGAGVGISTACWHLVREVNIP